jgi:lipopolysaccharide export system protein LptA
MRASCLVLTFTLLVIGLAPSGDARSQAVDAAPIAEATGQGKDVNIEADNMEVLDKSKQAIFTGNVNAERGGVTMKSSRLVVYYRSSAAGGTGTDKKAQAKSGAGNAGGGAGSQVTNLDATGNVIIITRTQKITGDKALIDVKANTLTVEGNVVVEQGSSVVKGSKLLVDLTSNRSQMTGGRVKGLFTPSQKSQ